MDRSKNVRIYATWNEIKRFRSHGVFLVGAFCAIALIAAASNVVAQNAPGKPATASMEVMEFRPGLDDLMTMLVQSRHIKLFYAGEAQNWQLAEFQMKELRSAFSRIGLTIPKYQNMSMDATVSSMMTPSLQALDAAIRAKNPKQFVSAYGELTDACNACHHVMNYAFLVVKVPSSPAGSVYPDQEFKGIAF